MEIWPHGAPISYRAGQEWRRSVFPVGGLIIGSVVLGGLVAAGWHLWQFVSPMLENPDPPQFQEAVRPTATQPQVATPIPSDPSPESDPEPGAEGPMAAGQRGQVIEPLGLYLRSAPNADAGILGGIVVGERVTVLELSANQEWQRVRRELNGSEGWVKAGYLGAVDPNAPEAVAQTPDPQEQQQTASAGTHRVSEPLGLYLRSAPDADADRLGGIVQGEAVTLLETSADGQWQRVRRELSGAEGWVKAGNLNAFGNSGSAPANPQPATAQAPATPDPNLQSSASNGDLFTYSAGNQARVMSPIGLALRAEPTAEGTYVGGIPVNEVIQVLGVSSDGQWQKVRRRSGQEGWVKAGNLGPE